MVSVRGLPRKRLEALRDTLGAWTLADQREVLRALEVVQGRLSIKYRDAADLRAEVETLRTAIRALERRTR